MTTITATKGELVNLINGLFQVQELKGKKFGLAVSKNIKILKDELQDLEDMGKPSEEFMALAEQVNEIANAGAEDSKEVIDNLEKENEELVKSRREQMDKITILMKEEASVKLNILTEDVLPEEITASQINNIIKIIK
jgi:small-conductance mechanosensitive channel